MAKGECDRRSNSSRKREYTAMLEAAQARPGVHEAMRVYGVWWERNRRPDAYRMAMKNSV